MSSEERYLLTEQNGKYGFRKADGTWLLPPVYDKIDANDDYPKRSVHEVWQNGLVGFVSDDYKVIMPCILKEAMFIDYGSFIYFDTKNKFDQWIYRVQHNNGKYGILSMTCHFEETLRYDIFFTGFIYDEVEKDGDHRSIGFAINGREGIFFFPSRSPVLPHRNHFCDADTYEEVKNAFPYTEE